MCINPTNRMRGHDEARRREASVQRSRPEVARSIYYRKRGSASYIVREVLSVREREREIQRERERRKWRHHCRAKIGDQHTFTCQKFAQMAMSLHFPLPKIRTFRFSLHTSRLSLHGEVTIVALKFAMSSHFPLPKIFSPALFSLFQMARAARRVIENPRQMIKSCAVLFCSSHRKTEYIVREVQSVRERVRRK